MGAINTDRPPPVLRMSLGDLLNGQPDDDESDDASFDPDAPEHEVRCQEVYEEEDHMANDPFEQYMTPLLGEGGVSLRWPARLRQLLHGSLEGGDPTSSTGLLAGVAPMLLHRSQSFHVERPARMVAVYHELFQQELVARARLVPARLASTEDLCLVHTFKHVRRATAVYETDEEATAALGLDSDTYFTARHSGYAARLSAGSVVELATRIAQGELRNALAVTRPPGHHCEQTQAMGFCLLDNVPVAVAALRERLGVRKVLVLDWDVHHGNGIQHMFEDDPLVLYVSLHRYGFGFYPGTGAPEEVGVGEGRGRSVNVGFRMHGQGDAEYAMAFERVVMPIAREFAPEMVFVSAGFDAAAGDPLGGMRLSPAGYAHMTEQLCSLAGGRVLVALEGGYDLRAISRAAAAVMRVLLGDRPPPLAAAAPQSVAQLDVEATMRCHAPFWRCMAARAAAEEAARLAQLERAHGGAARPAAPRPRPPSHGITKRERRADAGRRRRVPSAWWWRKSAIGGLRLRLL